MDIHKDDIWHGILFYPFDAILDGFKDTNDFNTWTHLSKELLQCLGSHDFVFNDQCFHSIIRFV